MREKEGRPMSNFTPYSCRQTVYRKVASHIQVIRFLLYFACLICTILGTMWGTLMLVPSLGSLFLAWWMMGEARVAYEYQLEGRTITVMRTSGMRSKQKTVQFLTLDLTQLIIMAEEGRPELDEAEARSKEQTGPMRRITYDVSAHDSNQGCYVAYAMGVGEETGRMLKVYMSPGGELRNYIRLLCPGKVHME